MLHTLPHLLLAVLLLQIPTCNPETATEWTQSFLNNPWAKSVQNFYASNVDKLYKKACSASDSEPLDISMTEVVVHQLSHTFGLDHYFHGSDTTPSSSYLCSLMSSYHGNVNHWERFLNSELQGVERNNGLSVEVVMGSVRALIRMVFFDYERVVNKDCEFYTLSMEAIKLVFVGLVLLATKSVARRAFGFALRNTGEVKGKTIMIPTDYSDNVLGDGDFSPR